MKRLGNLVVVLDFSKGGIVVYIKLLLEWILLLIFFF